MSHRTTKGKLTLRQREFVKAFIDSGGNATRAYREAYKGSTQSDRAAASSGYRLLKKPEVAGAIAEALEANGLTPDGIRSKLISYVQANAADFEPWLNGTKTFEQLAGEGVDTSCIQEIMATTHQTKHGQSVTRRLRFYDALQSATTLSRMLGMLPEKRGVHHSGLVGVGALDLWDKSEEELQAIRRALAAGEDPPPQPIDIESR